MTFTHLNSANRSQRNAGTVRRVMSALLTSALLIVGALAMSGSASAAPQGNMQNLLPNMTDQPRPVALHIKPVDFALGPGFCIFGTRHGKGSDCRGGSINDGNKCLIGRIPSSNGISAGPCFGPNFNWDALGNKSKCAASVGAGALKIQCSWSARQTMKKGARLLSDGFLGSVRRRQVMVHTARIATANNNSLFVSLMAN